MHFYQHRSWVFACNQTQTNGKEKAANLFDHNWNLFPMFLLTVVANEKAWTILRKHIAKLAWMNLCHETLISSFLDPEEWQRLARNYSLPLERPTPYALRNDGLKRGVVFYQGNINLQFDDNLISNICAVHYC